MCLAIGNWLRILTYNEYSYQKKKNYNEYWVGFLHFLLKTLVNILEFVVSFKGCLVILIEVVLILF